VKQNKLNQSMMEFKLIKN